MSIRFSCSVHSDDDAFAENPRAALVDLLEQMITKISQGRDGGQLLDINGNRCGAFNLDAEEEIDKDRDLDAEHE